MQTTQKHVRKAEQQAINIEMEIMWHKRALHHKGFSYYSGMMSREDLATAKERLVGLRTFIRENRKSFRPNGN
jgi:hypothetical protein